MKIGFVSDTHSNWPAFKKVLEELDKNEVDIKVHLGDLIGYGAYPNECVEATLSNFNYIVLGNHDLAATDLRASWGFNPLAKQAIEWTAANLTAENKEILKNLESGYSVEGLMFVHGSPAEAFDYIFSEGDARMGFSQPLSNFQTAFVGHTHIPGLWIMNDDLTIKEIKPTFEKGDYISAYSAIIPEKKRAIINVGSVGQPRDYDPRASYAIFETETRRITFFKVPYDIDLIVARMQRAGLPNQLYMRLWQGR